MFQLRTVFCFLLILFLWPIPSLFAAPTKPVDPFASIWKHPEAELAAKDFARGRFKAAAKRADDCLREEPLGEQEKVALGFLRGLSRLKLGLEPDPADFMRAMNAVDPPGIGDHAAWHFGEHLWKRGRGTSEAKAFELAEPYLKRVSLAGRYGLDAHLLLVRGAAAAGRARWACRWAQGLVDQRFRRVGESRAILALARAKERLAWSLFRKATRELKGEAQRKAKRETRREARQILVEATGLYSRVATLWPDAWAGSVAAENLKRLRKAGYKPKRDRAWLLKRARALVERPYGRRDRTFLWRLRGLLPADLKDPAGAEADLLLAELWIRYRKFNQAYRKLVRVRDKAGTPNFKARAGLLLARLVARRRPRAAIAEYLKVAKHWPKSSSAAPALFRAAELERRYNRAPKAAKLFERCIDEHAGDPAAAGCRWGLAWMAFREGKDDLALKHLEPLCELGEWLDDDDLMIEEEEEGGDGESGDDESEDTAAESQDDESAEVVEEGQESDELKLFDLGSRRLRERALYWRGRLLERQNRIKVAAAGYLRLMQERPFSYYALLAWERLAAMKRDDGWLAKALQAAEAGPPEAQTLHPEIGAAYTYYRMGLRGLARQSLRAMRLVDLEHGVDRRLAAQLWERFGDHRRSHRLAPVPRSGGLPDFPEAGWRTDARLAYPKAFSDVVESDARDARISPAMLYALMRVESGFWARARSPAGARGLTQVITRTGYAVARKLKLRGFRHWRLYEPRIAVQVGSAYLGDLLDRFGHPALAFAAYNAGETAVGRWIRRRGELPLDAFIEEIPFSETARYTRRILAYYAVYRVLYEGEASRPLELSFTQAAESKPRIRPKPLTKKKKIKTKK
ncbi:MAG: lytic transglycosylase domain-containing protein [Deltaproteobacteria bacterium]|nr:lytic transglycosylase domain-containing protein [Deltaproteobacteria bacterium]